MRLLEPVLRSFDSNPRRIPTNSGIDTMERHARHGAMFGDGYFAISYNFFTNIRSNALQPEMWLKRTVPPGTDIAIVPQAEIDAALNDDVAVQRTLSIAGHLGHSVQIQIFDDSRPWDDMDERRILQVVRRHGQKQRNHIVSLARLRDQIGERVGRKSLRMGQKGLSLATTALEKRLSETEMIFPGDVDLMVCRSDRPLFILELKKHTSSNRQYTFDQQRIENYSGAGDALKYKGLLALAEQVSDRTLPLYTVYYNAPDKGQKPILLEHVTHQNWTFKGRRVGRMNLDVTPSRNLEAMFQLLSNDYRQFKIAADAQGIGSPRSIGSESGSSRQARPWTQAIR